MMKHKITYLKSLAAIVTFFCAVVFSYGQTTWNGTVWSAGVPGIGDIAIINGDYNTSNGGDEISFSALSLTVNAGSTLTIDNGDYVIVDTDVIVDGVDAEIRVETSGAFVQNGVAGTAGTFTIQNSGNAHLHKETRTYPNDGGLHYTYWSSPTLNSNIITVFPDPTDNRRYYFDAQLFLDEHEVGTINGVQDDIDDDKNDWQVATGIMALGKGYAVTAVTPPFGATYNGIADFYGEFNTGDIEVDIYRNNTELNDNNWNLIGNPYPSAISTDDFFDENAYSVTNTSGTIEGAIYLWTHNSTTSAANPGNEAYNFSQDDYAVINFVGGVSVGDAAASGGDTPNSFIPSGQGFFVIYSDDAPYTGDNNPIYSNTVKFDNSMRDTGNNDQFFRTSNSKKQSKDSANKLWVNLTSDNGVSNQVLIGYINGATNNYDGLSYDAPRNLSSGASAILYSNIEDSDKKFAIQGKAENSLNDDEIIKLGLKTSIDVATIYTLSIAQLEGDFLTTNDIFLKDNLLNILHNLKDSDYNFTSVVGEFNNRFEIVFSEDALSVNNLIIDENALTILEHKNGNVQFKLNANINMSNIKIIDLQGRLLYNFSLDSKDETLTLSSLSQAPYIAKITLDNNLVITKKSIKKY